MRYQGSARLACISNEIAGPATHQTPCLFLQQTGILIAQATWLSRIAVTASSAS